MKMLAIIFCYMTVTFLWTFNSQIVADDCGDNKNFPIRLTIDSHRNDSGHWISQVELLHSDKGEGSGKQWTVDVVQKTSKCNESSGEMTNSNSFVSLDATLFTPIAEKAVVSEAEALHESVRESVREEAEAVLSVLEMHGESVAFSATPLSWAAARNACRNGLEGGGDLADLVTGVSLAHVVFLLEAAVVDKVYVGIRRDPQPPHHFRTISGYSLESSNPLTWMTGRPATKGPLAEDACLSVLKIGRLVDVDCEAMLPFVCSPSI